MNECEFPTYAELRRRFGRAGPFDRRTMIEIGAAFASFSIMTPVEDAERALQRWLDAGRPLALYGITDQLRNEREHRLRAVRALTWGQVEFIGLQRSPNVERIFAQLVWGYGPAKSCFAMACAGIGALPCLDSRMQRKYGIADREVERWPDYLAVCERLYPGVIDMASAQAFEWVADLARERYDTRHEVLLGGPAPQLRLDFGITA